MDVRLISRESQNHCLSDWPPNKCQKSLYKIYDLPRNSNLHLEMYPPVSLVNKSSLTVKQFRRRVFEVTRLNRRELSERLT